MSKTYKVMTFNLRVDVRTDPFVWEDRKNWIAQTIEKHQPDCIGTQEANIPMLAWLEDMLQESYEVYGVNRTTSTEVGEFSAIFVKRSTFTIGEKGSFMLSETPEVIGSMGWDAHCARICSWVELIPQEGSTPVLRFFNTHLDHMGQRARVEGLKLILDVIKEKECENPMPVLLTGDFNDAPDSETLKAVASMKSCYGGLSGEELQNSLTFHAYHGGTTGTPIDYIFADIGAELSSTIIIRDSIDGGFPSDHYPVMATVTVK
ncbi:endonuclease/exonuclease/phosphatase family metal-dependent hydrolase [Bacillus tianshenii]|uniref:Endonuclease/exonuclease/phosphatase family metal-dependent hydrolase n=1 Tax=Sutcliffiella tianshenii TaxID=1463404 RepID=A0ABS2NZT5_9BACI|nr:endonuclease/exonuclease/phosphatase family protein [Bacillus tianshenii]MBM7619873.1 endonuclease/exonuclease/phosphatase family metal-dependent hydrolase [Bacillus tianshenii]